jgi:hypothetical protein
MMWIRWRRRGLTGEVIRQRLAHGSGAVRALDPYWHMYNVHFKRFNRSMFTGRLPRQAMEEEHAEELEAIEQGERHPLPPSEVLARRRRRFWPYALAATIVLVGGLIWFVTFEQTAITTIPRREEVVFAPQLMPEEGDADTGAALWPTLRCGFCHGGDAGGGPDGEPALKETDLSFEEFHRQVRTGGDKMPAFGPEEIPDAYLLHLWTWLTGDTTP